MRWLWLFVLWASMAILMELGPLNLLVLPVMGFLTVNAWQSRSWRPAAVLLASPLPVLFISGLLAWFAERPTYHGIGLLRKEAFNLDRDTRTFQSTSGCVVNGGEFLQNLPFNSGLSLMRKAFGPPPQVYHGVYPTLEEGRHLTESGPVLPLEEFTQGKIRTATGRLFDLGEEQARQIIIDCGGYFPMEPEQPALQVRAVSMGDDCMLLRLTKVPDSDLVFGELDVVYLLDSKRRWPFARYVLAGDGAHHVPYFAHGIQ